jgi:hypothetical protein
MKGRKKNGGWAQHQGHQPTVRDELARSCVMYSGMYPTGPFAAGARRAEVPEVRLFVLLISPVHESLARDYRLSSGSVWTSKPSEHHLLPELAGTRT